MTRSVQYDNPISYLERKAPANFKSINKKTYKYVEDILALGGGYGSYKETLQAKYGKLISNNNQATYKDGGSARGWAQGTLIIKREEDIYKIREIVNIMRETGVFDLL